MDIIHQNKKGNRTFYYDEEKNYCIYDIPDIVAVLPVLPNNTIVLVEQFRVPANTRTVELVCGGIEDGETAELAAIREVKEEIGYNVKSLKSLGVFMSCPAYTTENVHLFVAYCDETEIGQELEYHEIENNLKKIIVSYEEGLNICETSTTRPELELALLKIQHIFN
jgi:ADP-ribose pyrophosphatase